MTRIISPMAYFRYLLVLFSISKFCLIFLKNFIIGYRFLIMKHNGQALCAVPGFRKGNDAKRRFFSEVGNCRWRSVVCPFRAKRRMGTRHCSAERLPVAVPGGAQRSMAQQRSAIRCASKFAGVLACSEFAEGWARWHGRIAIVVRSCFFY